MSQSVRCTVNLQQLIEYMKIHIVSLEQDCEEVNSQMDLIQDLNSDEYKVLELMDISLTGQIIGIGHIIKVAEGE